MCTSYVCVHVYVYVYAYVYVYYEYEYDYVKGKYMIKASSEIDDGCFIFTSRNFVVSNDSQRRFEVEKPLLESGSDLQNEITIMKLWGSTGKTRAVNCFLCSTSHTLLISQI